MAEIGHLLGAAGFVTASCRSRRNRAEEKRVKLF